MYNCGNACVLAYMISTELQWKRQGRPRHCAAIKAVRRSTWHVSRFCETDKAFDGHVAGQKFVVVELPTWSWVTTPSGTSSSEVRRFALRAAGSRRRQRRRRFGSAASPPVQLGNDTGRPWTSPGTLTSDSRFLCAVLRDVACRPFMFCTCFVCVTSLFPFCAYTYKKII